MKIILASASPRRKELLQQIGLEFEIQVSDADENVSEKSPVLLVEKLSERKATAVKEMRAGKALASPQGEVSQELIIGADTVVCYQDEILGKPKDAEDAFRMLSLLQGKSHKVYTGVTLLLDDRSYSFHEETEVELYPMTEEEIREYISVENCYDKAGSYAIQGFFARYIKGIRGDYNNVVGLPVARLYQELKCVWNWYCKIPCGN